MLISTRWLQDFFEAPLPNGQEIADLLTLHTFEVEGVETKGTDTVIDVKVLPNRPDALSHRGIAKELSAILGIPMKNDPLREEVKLEPITTEVSVSIQEMSRSRRYIAGIIRGVKIGPSPAWLRERLEAVGERSINNVVDATNYVMLHVGQPLHAFDVAKIQQGIVVRGAQPGEKFTALGGTEYAFGTENTVISDAAGRALAAGGIKGGITAEITDTTTDVLIEAAHFDPVVTRLGSKTLGLRTGASARFEHGLPVELPVYGMHEVVKLILQLAEGELAGFIDVGQPLPPPHYTGVSTREVNSLLGTSFSDADIADVLKRLGFVHMHSKTLEQVEAQAREYVGRPDAGKVVCLPDESCECDSLVCLLYSRAGVNLPGAIADQFVWGDPINAEDAVPGDVVFAAAGDPAKVLATTQLARGTHVSEPVNHIGIFLGEGLVAHASHEKGIIAVESLADVPEFAQKTLYRRMVPTDEKRFVVEVPFEREDIRISTDLIEEVARIRGMDNITPQPLPAVGVGEIHPVFSTVEAVRSALTKLGLVELYTYSLTDEGSVAPANALVRGRDHMRDNLSRGVTKTLDKNALNMPLLGLADMRVFEVGNVFAPGKETLHVAVAARVPGKKGATQAVAIVEESLVAVAYALGLDRSRLPAAAEIVEFDLEALLPDVHVADVQKLHIAPDAVFAPISSYPFILRDIAAWMPAETSSADITACIREHGTNLLQRIDQFDEFTKEHRTSRAFHLVFQSHEKTLTDVEVNEIMNTITAAFAQKGWEVR